LTFGSGTDVGVVSGCADAVFASLLLRVPATASAAAGSCDGAALASESTWGASGSADSDVDNVDMVVIVVTGGVGSCGPPTP
jgi:hypothetical protein